MHSYNQLILWASYNTYQKHVIYYYISNLNTLLNPYTL